MLTFCFVLFVFTSRKKKHVLCEYIFLLESFLECTQFEICYKLSTLGQIYLFVSPLLSSYLS